MLLSVIAYSEIQYNYIQTARLLMSATSVYNELHRLLTKLADIIAFAIV